MNLEDGPFFKICVDSGNQSVTPGAGFAASQSRSEAGDLSALWTPRFAWGEGPPPLGAEGEQVGDIALSRPRMNLALHKVTLKFRFVLQYEECLNVTDNQNTTLSEHTSAAVPSGR
jgi:hypothetical protein